MSEISADKQRLLVVDDSKVIRVTARKILQNHFAILEAVDGEDAWEKLTNEPDVSLVVSDLTMPKLDGFELLDRIRNSHDPRINALPVIIITGANDSEATMQRASAAGATDFIGKPFDAVHLLARTQAHANAHAANQALGVQNMSLEAQSTVDTLTGLSNEAALMERGLQMLSYAIRHNGSLAVAQIEIDHFGELFKRHGKEATDQVLEHTARLLESGVRSEDMVARIGTARFVLLLPAMDAAGVRRLADRIAGDIRKRSIGTGDLQLRCTVSIGIAAPGIRKDTRLENILNVAGNRLRKAITDGGDRIATHDSEVAASGTRSHPPHIPQGPATDANLTSAEAPVPDASPESAGKVDPSSWTLAEVAESPITEDLPEITIAAAMVIEEDMEIRADKGLFPGSVPRGEAQPEYVLEEEIEITSPYAEFEGKPGADTAKKDHEPAQPGVQKPVSQTTPVTPATTGAPDTAEPGMLFPAAAEAAADTADLQDDDSMQPPAGLFRRVLRRLFRTGS